MSVSVLSRDIYHPLRVDIIMVAHHTIRVASKVNHFIFLSFFLGWIGLLEWPITTQKVSKILDTPNIEFILFFPLSPIK
jgi:hypothetical protein